ncbi:MAG: hypothetical protein ABWZ98_10840 [Nakamurella sp.]
MGSEPQPPIDNQTVRPCPGHQVTAVYDLPYAARGRTQVKAGATGEIVRVPAHFCSTYSIKFLVHGKEITVHGVNRHEFRVLSDDSALIPGFPPARRFPQPPRATSTTAQPQSG